MPIVVGSMADTSRDSDEPNRETHIERSGRCLYDQRCATKLAEYCAFCGRKAKRYEAHHAIPLSDGGPQTKDDGAVLTALCPECHRLAHLMRRVTEKEKEKEKEKKPDRKYLRRAPGDPLKLIIDEMGNDLSSNHNVFTEAEL